MLATVVRGLDTGLVTFSLPGVDAAAIVQSLAEKRINVSLSNIYRTFLDPAQDAIGTFVRASVHYITTDEEIDSLIAAPPRSGRIG